MTTLAISLLEAHLNALRAHLFQDNENERASYVFFWISRDSGDELE